ncbi:AraC family transcriptional regulator [Agrobacterium vitis]|uniref:Helix-turn-helix domain-containing protein n=1 Tax=Agrobacterium vitis TaxID=373 RepID=A0AAE5AVS1_AGRVI|nr:AraC family transcriptional regulator [Agrobacterium vitis]MCF1499348.1 AraC family transcriptional regulator [Allorhizobium sp. Av2]MCM2439400.1 AraC family transcriptional regulator [Agrobacterium vitis]MUZ57696.1 helix-turn-helix domain-containing protein [Agrobacterium vitis]
MQTGRYHHLSWLQGIEIFEADFTSHTFGRHSHEGFAIGAIAAGVGGYLFRGANVLLPAGSLSLMNPDEAHTGHAASDELRYNMLYVSEEAVRTLLDLRELLGFSQIAPGDPGQELSHRLAFLAALLNAAGTADQRLAIEEGVHSVLGGAFVRYGRAKLRAPGSEPRALVELRERIAAAVADGSGLSLGELAAGIGLHPSYLIRTVRHATGMTPHALVLQKRASRARELLLQGMPAAQAATAAGFSDQAHMIRQFRRHYGVTPGALIRH